jgi:hypothetical protein
MLPGSKLGTCLGLKLLYVSDGHVSQVAFPRSILKDPAAHGNASVPSAPENPALAIHSVIAVDASGLIVFMGHSTHDTLPSTPLKVARGQGETTESAAPVKPKTAKQSKISTDDDGLPVLAGHESHVSNTCATEDLYLPPSQFVVLVRGIKDGMTMK